MKPAPTTADCPPRPSLSQLQRSHRSRTAQRRGTNAELLVGLRLRQLGFRCLERVVTPKTSRVVKGKLVTRHTRKVSGDWRGVGAGGRSLIVEVKKRGARNLCFSDFAPHQWASLRDHHAAGGISLIAYLAGDTLYFLPIQYVQIGPGESIAADAAAAIDRIGGKAPCLGT